MAVGSIYTARAPATSLISNNSLATEQQLTYDTEVDTSADVTRQSGNQAYRIQNTGRYLILTTTSWNGIDLGNNNRAVVRTQVKVGGTNLTGISGNASGYLRDSGSADECHVITASYVDHTVVGSSADDVTVWVQNFGDTSVALADQIADSCGIQIIRLDDGADWIQVRRAAAQSLTSAQGTGVGIPADAAFTTISFDTQDVETDSAVAEWVSGTDVTLKSAGHYLVILNTFGQTSGTTRNGAIHKLMLNDANINGGTWGLNMSRGSDGSIESWAALPVILDVAANDVLTVDTVAVGETSTSYSMEEVQLTAIKLPDTADYIRTRHSTARDGQTTGVFPQDAEDEDDLGIHSTVTNTDRINGTADDHDMLLFGAWFTTQTSTTNSTRVTHHFRWSRTGTIVQYGSGLSFHRGDQSTTGLKFGGRAAGIAAKALGSTEYMSLDMRLESGTGDQTRDFPANRVGITGVALDTLAGVTAQDISPSLASSLTAAFAPVASVGAVDISPALKAQLIATFAPSVSAITSMNLAINAGGNDGFGFSPTTFSATGTVETVGDDGDASHMYFRFQLTDDLVGATIDSAVLKMWVDGATTDVEIDVVGDDSDNPSAPTSWATLDGITPTTATVKWILDTAGGDADLTSPDIKAIIQELVDSYGPLDTEYIQFVLDPDAYTNTDVKAVHMYESVTYTEPRLEITYTPSSSLDITPAIASQLITALSQTVTPGLVDITPGLLQQLAVAFDPSLTTTVSVSPSLAVQLIQTFLPTLTTGPVDISPSLAQQLALGFDPTVTPGSVDISPALAQRLVQSYDPTLTTTADIIPTLIQQLIVGLDPTLTYVADITPGLAQELVNTFDPSIAVGAVNISPALVQQLLIAFNPTLTTGSVDISPALMSQLIVTFLPQLDMNLHPGLVQELLIAIDPTLTYVVDIVPGLVQQLVVTYDPVVAPGAVFITPALLQTLLVGVDPAIGGGIVIYPDVANQLVLAYDPTVDLGAGSTQDIIPAIMQQLTSANDPTVAPGPVAIEPGLLQALLNGLGPELGGDDQPRATTTMSDWSG